MKWAQNMKSCIYNTTILAVAARVPEFATLAIPVILLLGLVFYMRRKEQK